MIKEEKIRKELKKLEDYILGDLKLGELQHELIYIINDEKELMSQKVRRTLRWVLEIKKDKQEVRE